MLHGARLKGSEPVPGAVWTALDRGQLANRLERQRREEQAAIVESLFHMLA
jgi:hypothetical protein